MSEMTRELMTLGDSQSKALELADGSYGMGKEELQTLVVREWDVGCWMLDGKDLTELMACYIQFNLGTADVIRWVDPVHQFQALSSCSVSFPARFAKTNLETKAVTVHLGSAQCSNFEELELL